MENRLSKKKFKYLNVLSNWRELSPNTIFYVRFDHFSYSNSKENSKRNQKQEMFSSSIEHKQESLFYSTLIAYLLSVSKIHRLNGQPYMSSQSIVVLPTIDFKLFQCNPTDYNTHSVRSSTISAE